MSLLTYQYDPVGTASVIIRAMEAGQQRQQQQAQFAAQLAKEAADNRRLSLEFGRRMDFEGARLGLEQSKEDENTRRFNVLNAPVSAPTDLPTGVGSSPSSDVPSFDPSATGVPDPDALSATSAPGVNLYNAGSPAPQTGPLLSQPSFSSDLPDTSSTDLQAPDTSLSDSNVGDLTNGVAATSQAPAVDPTEAPSYSSDLPDLGGAVDPQAAMAQQIADTTTNGAHGQLVAKPSVAGPLPTGGGPSNGPAALMGGDISSQLHDAQQALHNAGVPAHIANQQLAELVRTATTARLRAQTQLEIAQMRSQAGGKAGATPQTQQDYIAQNQLTPTGKGTYKNEDGAEFNLQQSSTTGRWGSKPVDHSVKYTWKIGSDGVSYAFGNDGEPAKQVPDGVTFGDTPKLVKSEDGSQGFADPRTGKITQILPPGTSVSAKDKTLYTQAVLDAAKLKADAEAKTAALAQKTTGGFHQYFGVTQSDVDEAQKKSDEAHERVATFLKQYPQLAPPAALPADGAGGGSRVVSGAGVAAPAVPATTGAAAPTSNRPIYRDKNGAKAYQNPDGSFEPIP